MDDYALLDAGDGARLERFGPRITDRPHPGALAPRRDAAAWRDADLRFDRDGGWSASDVALLEPWTVRVGDLLLALRPTDAGQVGLFPEHLASLDWLTEQVTRHPDGPTPPVVLHLFAYTGLATLAMARAGAAVAHVDASRPAVAWARENADLNGLTDRPIRWLVDDAPTFVARETRRGRRYDGIVLDPPTYGHGERRGQAWRIETDLEPLLEACRTIASDDAFVLLTAHTEAFGPERLGALLDAAWGGDPETTQTGELVIDSEAGGRLELGAFARRVGRP